MKYEYWFASLELSCKKKMELRQVIKTAEQLYYIEETQLKKYLNDEKDRQVILDSIRNWRLNEEYEKMIQKGVHFVTILTPQYPKRLQYISSPPYALFIKGNLPSEDKKSVAIVGARECTPYGDTMAREFAQALAKAGVQIISGMARGVDSAGQQAALEVGGTSFGVLGCGVDICYPREQIGLYKELQQQGGLLSEFKVGTNPLPQYFPARNRIISGLSDVVLVIEAKEKSGSLITADMALDQGKDVYALPGPVNSRLSAGCNRLIRQGAGILLTPEDLLQELGISFVENDKKIEQIKLLLESKEELVYSCLDLQPQNLDSLFNMTKIPVTELLDILMGLELRGIVKEISKNYYVRTK